MDEVDLAQLSGALSFQRLTPEQLQYWRDQMRTTPQWFVLGRTHQINDRWHAVAGPFADPTEAQQVACALEARVCQGESATWAFFRTQINSLAEVMRIYQNDVPQVVDDLENAEEWLRGLSPHPTETH